MDPSHLWVGLIKRSCALLPEVPPPWRRGGLVKSTTCASLKLHMTTDDLRPFALFFSFLFFEKESVLCRHTTGLYRRSAVSRVGISQSVRQGPTPPHAALPAPSLLSTTRRVMGGRCCRTQRTSRSKRATEAAQLPPLCLATSLVGGHLPGGVARFWPKIAILRHLLAKNLGGDFSLFDSSSGFHTGPTYDCIRPPLLLMCTFAPRKVCLRL